MEKIGKAGRPVPAAVNFQPQKIHILKRQEALARIRPLTRFVYGAPVVLLFCADTSKVRKSPVEHGYHTGEVDMRIVCSHMTLEAWERSSALCGCGALTQGRRPAPLTCRGTSIPFVCCPSDIPEETLSLISRGIMDTHAQRNGERARNKSSSWYAVGDAGSDAQH